MNLLGSDNDNMKGHAGMANAEAGDRRREFIDDTLGRADANMTAPQALQIIDLPMNAVAFDQRSTRVAGV